jgi:MoxR-like ATPase
MTQNTIRTLYEYGKKVYLGEMNINDAVEAIKTQDLDVASSSARHYIRWYPLMRTGSSSTWNSNSELLLYYARRIIEEEGVEAGKTAILSALKFAKHVSRAPLEQALNELAQEFDIPHLEEPWWPTKELFDPKLTKDDWKKYILDIELPNHPAPMKMLKGMLELGGEATCKLLSDTYGGHPSAYAGCAMNLGRRVKKYFNLSACMDGAQERYFPFPFLGKYQGSNQDNYIYRIRPELLAALNELDLSGISPYYESEHDTGRFDSWEILDDNTAIKHCDKSFFDYRGSGIPKNICWFFDAENMELGETKAIELVFNGSTYPASIKNESSDRRRVRVFWNVDLGSQFNVYRNCNTMVIFKKVANDTYEVSIKEGEKEMTIKDKLAAVKEYIAAKGFVYKDDLVENFYLSLKSKPFVILAGTSGTGKTKLVQYFAESIGAEMLLVPVRPDWSDSSDLFGHCDLSSTFHPGAVLKFLQKAKGNPNVPHILCLDEMNLARVEYYFSDFLSIIETRKWDLNKNIVTQPLIDEDYYKCDAAAKEYGVVTIPDNFYIVGTVNMDETTFPFSKKVLDRANTIEFSLVDLTARPVRKDEAASQALDNAFLKADYLNLIDCDDDQVVEEVCEELQAINQLLENANLHVGYRVRDEIVFYMLNRKKADLLTADSAFDHEIMQKILPRIQGSSTAIKVLLHDLFVECAGDYTKYSGQAEHEKMSEYLKQETPNYPNSAKKIAFMMRRYEEDGFTSYWL